MDNLSRKCSVAAIEEVMLTGQHLHLHWGDEDDYQIVDMQTANMFMTVFKALNEESKRVYAQRITESELKFIRVVDAFWSAVA